MKKTAILLVLLTSAAISNAQTKKVYQPDLTKKLSVEFNISTQQAYGYIFTLQNGGPDKISSSDKLSGLQIQFYLKGYSDVLDSISTATFKTYQRFYKEGEAKWAADTLREFKGAKPAKK